MTKERQEENKMSEMENFDMEQATTEALDNINLDANGMEMVGGAVAGGTISGVLFYKLGYAAGIKDAAHAKKMEPKALLKEIKTMKGEKKKEKGFTLFGYKFQVNKVKDSKESDVTDVKNGGTNDSTTNK
jgi:hypothetical protein